MTALLPSTMPSRKNHFTPIKGQGCDIHFRSLYTVVTRILHTPRFPDLRFGLYSPNQLEYENKRYTIEKPYKLVTRNAKKNFEFSKICKIFRAFFEKAVFLENGRGQALNSCHTHPK